LGWLDRGVKEKQVPCKTVCKAFQVKLVEIMPRVCKAVFKAMVGYFEESQV
jgi:hypothetical protein